MIELYIAGYKADVDKNIDIALTYESLDTSSPQAIKNSFSKSVELKGTKNNNKIFGEVYKLDRDTLESGLIYGISYDPNKRTPFKLLNNGELIESGYFQLDEITKNGNEIQYSITLYGVLGDFFYNLSVGEDGKELKLSDLDFTLAGNSIYLSDEGMANWDAHNIASDWSLAHSTGGSDVLAVPTYSGYYDDFDNNKILINYHNLNSTVSDAIGDTITNSGGTVIGAPLNDFGIVEVDRDLDEWEVKDFRSNFQRPAVKNSFILDAIADPKNNGGYNLIYSEGLRNSPYFKDTYFIQSRINPEDVQSSDIKFDFGGYKFESVNQVEQISISNAVPTWLNGVHNKRVEALHGNYYLMREDGVQELTITDEIINHYYTLTMPLTINYDGIPSTPNYNNPRTVGYSRREYYWHGPDPAIFKVVAGVWVNIDIYLNGTLKEQYSSYIYSDPDNLLYKDDRNGSSKKFLEVMKQYNFGRDFNLLNFPIVRNKAKKAIMLAQINLDLQTLFKEASTGDKLRIRFSTDNTTFFMVLADNATVKTGWSDAQIFGSDNDSSYYYGSSKEHHGNDGMSMSLSANENLSMGFVSEEGSSIQTMLVTKANILNSDKSPFEYLTSFAKMLNLKFEVEKDLKQIKLMMPWEYYKDEVKDINDIIDRGDAMTITPHVAETQYYSYCLPTPETYASSMVKKKTGREYGEYIKDTGYNFEKETTDVFDENIFTNLVPYRLSSAFFTNVTRDNVLLPSFLNCGGYKLTLASTETNEAVSEDKVGLGGVYSKPLSKSYDGWSKLCAFDNDNNTVDDATDCLVFLDGWIDVSDKHYAVSDNLLYMLDINEGTPCHIYSDDTVFNNSPYESDHTGRYIEVNYLPRFTKDIQGYSLDISTPAMTFEYNKVYDAGATIYNKFFKSEVDDLYNKNAKRVECSLFLEDTPAEALKKFYTFDGALWVMVKINDYSVGKKEPTSCEFVKVNDIRAYITDPYQNTTEEPTSSPSEEPTPEPEPTTEEPTPTPTPEPTEEPTDEPTDEPTPTPTPTPEPTDEPTDEPTPTPTPTPEPTDEPTEEPTTPEPTTEEPTPTPTPTPASII